MVDVRYEDNLAPRGFDTIPACLIKEKMILRVANGQVELQTVIETDHRYTCQTDNEDRRVFPEIEVTYTDELAVYYDAVNLSFVDFLIKYGARITEQSKKEA